MQRIAGIIKEFCEENATVVVRSYHYNRTGAAFELYYQEALKDFPNLLREEYEIMHYRNGYGIEFTSKIAPENYTRVTKLEQTK